MDSLEDFAHGRKVRVRPYGVRLDAQTTIARAESKVGESGYNLFANNCEHFAAWCVADQHSSPQVRDTTARAGLVTVSGCGGGRSRSRLCRW